MSDWGLGALALIVFLNSAFVGGIAFFLWKLNQKLEELAAKVEPLTGRVTETLGRVDRITEMVQTRAETILDRTAELVDKVSDKVDTTTAIAEETISQPLIGAASVMAGISRGLKTYREQAAEKGDSH